MELNITELFNSICPSDFSASAAEIGSNAGIDTYNAALGEAEDWPNLLKNQDDIDEFSTYVENMGYSEDLSKFSRLELVALLIQIISGDIRQHMSEFGKNTGEFNWSDYEESDSAGRLFRGDDNNIYYYIGF